MENIREIEIEDTITGEIATHIIIDRGDGEFTSMLKSTYDQIQAAKEAQSL